MTCKRALPVAVATASGVDEELALVGLEVVVVGLDRVVASSGLALGQTVEGVGGADGDDDDVILGFRSCIKKLTLSLKKLNSMAEFDLKAFVRKYFYVLSLTLIDQKAFTIKKLKKLF